MGNVKRKVDYAIAVSFILMPASEDVLRLGICAYRGGWGRGRGIACECWGECGSCRGTECGYVGGNYDLTQTLSCSRFESGRFDYGSRGYGFTSHPIQNSEDF